MKCVNCQTENEKGSTYCTNCGQGLPRSRKKIMVCPHCNTEYDSTNILYCPIDGTKLVIKLTTQSFGGPGPKNHISPPEENRASIMNKDEGSEQIQAEVVTTEQRGFVGGYIWIFLAYATSFGSFALFLYTAIEIGDPRITLVGILFIPTALSGRGIQLRRRWGLNLTFVLLVGSLFGSCIEILYGDMAIPRGIVQIIIAVFWLQYFGKKSLMFR